MQYLAKVVAIYTSKKIEFDSKNNHEGNKSAYFWLVDSQLHFIFQMDRLYILSGLKLRNVYLFW